MVGGISGGSPTHGPYFGGSNISPYDKNQLTQVLNGLSDLMMQVELQGLSAMDPKTIAFLKGCVQNVLNAKPAPSQSVATQCQKILDDLTHALQAAQSGHKEDCLGDLQDAQNRVGSILF